MGKLNYSFLIILLIVIGFILGEIEYLINPYYLLYSEQFNYLVFHGFFYEVITSIFVTNSFTDFAFNSISMYVIYLLFKNKAGRLELLVFLEGGIIGNIFSLFFYPLITLSAGASGGIFAILSFYVFYDFVKERELGIYGLLYLLVVFLLSDVFLSNVDVAAHIGGILSGITIAGGISLKNKSDKY